MCTCMIVNLMPEASLEQQPQNQEVAEVLKSVRRYNLLFLGGARGFIQQKVRELPFFINRIFQGLMDPDTNDTYIAEIRLFAVKFSAYICCEDIYIYICIYTAVASRHRHAFMYFAHVQTSLHKHFTSGGGHVLVLVFILRGIGIGRVFDCSAIILILILRLVGIYRRRRLMQ
ncbi:hypothetical protein Goklo_025583, partial [Gossypium klotzschianum]|nr:hypothetical protein [Gossypium klotzschianum]